MGGIKFGVAAAAAVVTAHAPAGATIITINGTTNAQIECVSESNPGLDPACRAFSGGAPNGIGHGVGDPTTTGGLGLAADLYDGEPAGDQFELAQINILAGASFTLADFNKGPDDPGAFKSSAEYILFKLSNTAVWIRNFNGGALMLTYTDSTCRGGAN